MSWLIQWGPWILLSWLLVALMIGRKAAWTRHKDGRFTADAGWGATVGLTWPLWVPVAAILAPFVFTFFGVQSFVRGPGRFLVMPAYVRKELAKKTIEMK